MEDSSVMGEIDRERGEKVAGGASIGDEESVGEDSAKRGRLRIANVGGSLTVLLQIALVAWGVRQLRSVLAKRQQRTEAARRAEELPYRAVDPPAFAMLSPNAVQKMVELNPVTHLLVDVRHLMAVEESPVPFVGVVNIPESEVKSTLQLSDTEWENRFSSTATKPSRSDVIVFISTRGRRAQKVAIAAADLGYSGCCVLSGGIEAYEAAVRNPVEKPLTFLSRDAVATLLQRNHRREPTEAGPSSVHLVDVRRHDERALYGHIRGSKHVPVDELPKALNMEGGLWERIYHFPKFAKDDTVIFQCRKVRRASWAAQLAQDAGWERCFVYKQGVYGWRFDPTVLPYDSYEQGDAPPDPLNFEIETVNREAANLELEQFGLL